jgi:hypothetical protein
VSGNLPRYRPVAYSNSPEKLQAFETAIQRQRSYRNGKKGPAAINLGTNRPKGESLIERTRSLRK